MRVNIFITIFLFVLNGCTHVSHVPLYNGPALSPKDEATIILPESFDLLELNGQTVSDTRLSFRSHDMPLTLPSGSHVIVFQYKAFWQIDDDNHDTITSGPITFKVDALKAEVLSFEFPDIKQYEQAQKFSENPELFLVSNRQKIPSSHTPKDNPLVLNATKTAKATEYPNLDQLKFWWNRATYYEQEAFLSWQKEHSSIKK